MRKFFFLLSLTLILSACKKDSVGVLFPFPLQDNEFTIPPTASPFQVHYFNIQDVPTNVEGLFETNNRTLDEAVGITPSAGQMVVIGDNTDYDFIQQMSVRICEAGDNSENCGVEIFWRQPVPQGVGSILDLVPSDADVKDFLSQDKVNIQVKLEQLRTAPPSFVLTRLLLDFDARE